MTKDLWRVVLLLLDGGLWEAFRTIVLIYHIRYLLYRSQHTPVLVPIVNRAIALKPIMIPVPKKLSKILSGRSTSVKGFVTSSAKISSFDTSFFWLSIERGRREGDRKYCGRGTVKSDVS